VSQNKLKFKVIGSYTIETFYIKEFELDAKEIADKALLIEEVEQMALEDERENGLEGWDEEWFKVIGDTFYIEKVIFVDHQNNDPAYERT
jgi:hypothetical protein